MGYPSVHAQAMEGGEACRLQDECGDETQEENR